MVLSKQDANELHELLCEIWDQGASADRLARLEALAEALGEPAYEQIFEYTSLHANLGASMSSSRAFEASVAAVLNDHTTSLVSPRTTGDLCTPSPITALPHELPPKRRRLRTLGRLTLAVSLLMAIGLGSWWLTSPPSSDHQAVAMRALFRPPQPVASVIEETDAVWAEGRSIGIDMTLRQGQVLALEQGSAQVSMACGADMVLQAPCTVKLVADDLVELQSGKLTAQAAAWATGFVIETKGLRITDLGTKFAVSADSTGVSEAHVLEGSVLAEPMRAIRPKRSSMLLNKGEAIRVSLPRSTIDLIAAKSSDFIDHLPTFRPLRPIRISNTGLGGVIGQEDRHWSIVSGDPANGPYPRPAVITKPDRSYLDNMPDASQWISVDSKPYAAPDSVHKFETRFDLTGYDLNTVCMVGLFLVDDAINELSINGNRVPFERWTSKWDVQDFQRFRAIVIDQGFVPGENVISIDVYNSPNNPAINNSQPNPVGLRVEWQAFACESNSALSLTLANVD